MKIRYQIFDLDPLEKQHLDANVRYSMLDMLLEGRRSITRLEASRILNSRHLPAAMSNMVSIMKSQKATILEDMSKMYYLKLDTLVDGCTVLELFISSDYFMLGDILTQQFGRAGKHLIRVVDQQTIINKLEEDLKKVYMRKFSGEVIESDGKKLVVNR